MLWEMLEATWAVKHAVGSQRRPPACTVLDRLKECVDYWGESIVPIIPESWEASGGCRMSPDRRHSLFMSFLRQQVLVVVSRLGEHDGK